MAVLQRAYFQGHTYLLLDHPDASKWWAQDEAEAVSLGGHLATVDSAAEDAFIFSSFANTVQTTAASLGQATNHTWIFIGLTDQATEGVRVWSSGAPVGYTNFLQPNQQDVFVDQDFVAIDVGVVFQDSLNTFTPGGWHTLISNSGPFGDVPYAAAELPLLQGTDAAESLIAGTSGADLIRAFGGADTLNGLGGGDTMEGGLGNDTYFVDSQSDVTTELLFQGNDTVRSTVTRALTPNVENLTLLGSASINGTGNNAANILTGNNGRNILNGSFGTDKLVGGLGRDVMTGGAQRDIFDFNAIGETGKNFLTRDVIKDFRHGIDDIDLFTIDAKAGVPGNQKFTFIGQGAFTGVKGELHYKLAGANTIVEGDTDGNGLANFQIELTGLKVLTGGDFIL